jgi:predicted amidohydrolase YtcJ
MRADMIIKNAKIFTADKDNPQAAALVVKDGKFAYVGDENGLSEYEGEVTDLNGKFIMPGIIDSHVHVTFPVGFEYADEEHRFECSGKQEAMDYMADYISRNPGLKRYRFMLDKKYLNGEDITKEDLDRICPDAELQIQEAEGHSIWINSKLLSRHGITDDTPDPVPGLSYYVRKDGHVTGNIFEGSAEMPIILDSAPGLSDEQIDAALERWIDFSVNAGVTAVFDSGIPGFNEFHERVYERLRELDRQGKLPVYVDGCYVVAAQWEVEKGLRELKRFRREFSSEHMKVHTMKVFMDGTQAIHTAAMVTPYVDTNTTGSTAFTKEELAELLKQLNEEGLDLHLHTVGERASRVVLDGVELIRKELGENFHVKVTCAHLEVQDDADLPRFARLGVIANYTPQWHAGYTETLAPLLGEERAKKQFRCKTVWDSGALVTWSCDEINFDDFTLWSPYLGMEVGMTRLITEKTRAYEFNRSSEVFPPANERMSIEEMILGYTINGAKQLGIDNAKGSIAIGKDADFLVFDNNLLEAEQEGFSHNMPKEVYITGKKVN